MGIILVSTSLSLLVVYAGLILLIRVRKEVLGNLFRTAAWLFIAAGLFILLATGGLCIIRCMKFGMRMQGGKMKHSCENMDMHKMHKQMMKYHQGGMGGMGMGHMNSCGMMNGPGSMGCGGMMSGCGEKNSGMDCCGGMMKMDTAKCMHPMHGTK